MDIRKDWRRRPLPGRVALAMAFCRPEELPDRIRRLRLSWRDWEDAGPIPTYCEQTWNLIRDLLQEN